MPQRVLEWVNTPVLMEAILRYEQNRLPKPMRLWVEDLLEINPSKKTRIEFPISKSEI